MTVCCCALAGTQACINCPNNTYRGPVWQYYPPYQTYTPRPEYVPYAPPIDMDELAKKVAELLKEQKKEE